MTCVSVAEKPAGRANLRFADDGGIAQLAERLVRNEKARGSNPLTSSAGVTGEGRDCRAKALAKAELFLSSLHEKEPGDFGSNRHRRKFRLHQIRVVRKNDCSGRVRA